MDFSDLKPTGGLKGQLWAVENFITQRRQEQIDAAKKTYAQVMARRAQQEPGDGVLLWMSASVFWPLLDLPENDRAPIRFRKIHADLDRAAELDRKDALLDEQQGKIDAMQLTANDAQAEFDRIAQETAGDSSPNAIGRRREASGKHLLIKQQIEEKQKRLDREAEELRLEKAQHRRLYGGIW